MMKFVEFIQLKKYLLIPYGLSTLLGIEIQQWVRQVLAFLAPQGV